MHIVLLELRTTLRSLSRSPGFVATAVLVLALGLGANLILFNAIHALLWRPLAFPHPERLMFMQLKIDATDTGMLSGTGRDCAVVHDHLPEVAEIGMAEWNAPIEITPGDEVIKLSAAKVNSGYLRALELKPLRGRLFGPEEDQKHEGEFQAILTEATWRSRFGADPSIVGRLLPGVFGHIPRPVRILGVIRDRGTLPFAHRAEILLPIPWMDPAIRSNGRNFYDVLIRLKPGVNPVQASPRMEATFAALGNLGPEFPLDRRYILRPLREVLAPSHPKVVFLMWGAASLLLLLAAVNVASLFVARSLNKVHEAAVRTALGATYRDFLRTHFLEALLVCGGGLALAYYLDLLARPLVLSYLPEVKRVGPELLQVSPALLGFGGLLCLSMALLMAFLTSLQAQGMELAPFLAQGGYTGIRARHSLRSTLMSVQMALILVLLTMEGLVARSFMKTLTTDPGFRSEGVVCFEADTDVKGDARISTGFDLVHLATSLPGTRAATFSLFEPVGPPNLVFDASSHQGSSESSAQFHFQLVATNYFETLGAQLKAGRTFTESEVKNGSPVIILNESAARVLFPGRDPLGQTVFGRPMKDTVVVGIVNDLRTDALDQAHTPLGYLPYSVEWDDSLNFAVRSDLKPEVFEKTLRTRVKNGNAGIRLGSFKPLSDMAAETVQGRQRASLLLGGIAFMGLLAGVVGLYGTLSAQVQRQRREIGIRMALGATAKRIMQQIIAQGWRWVGAGALAGLAGSLAAARLVQHELFEVGPMDGTAFLLALGLLCTASLLACLMPALHAARIEPAETLRSE